VSKYSSSDIRGGGGLGGCYTHKATNSQWRSSVAFSRCKVGLKFSLYPHTHPIVANQCISLSLVSLGERRAPYKRSSPGEPMAYTSLIAWLSHPSIEPSYWESYQRSLGFARVPRPDPPPNEFKTTTSKLS
jgi:hypothetical protein